MAILMTDWRPVNISECVPMVLAPEKRTKLNFLNHTNSSAILRMPTPGFEPKCTRAARRWAAPSA